jgi:hypothetical protein
MYFIQQFINISRYPSKEHSVRRGLLMKLYSAYIIEYERRYKKKAVILRDRHTMQIISQKIALFLKKRGLRQLNTFTRDDRGEENWYGFSLNTDVVQIAHKLRLKATGMVDPELLDRRTNHKYKVDP